MLVIASATSLRAGACAAAIICESRWTVSSCPPARATVSVCPVSASLSPAHAVRANMAASAAARKRMRVIYTDGRGQGRTAVLPSWENNCSERADQALENGRSAESRELQRQRLHAPHVDLELHVLEGGRERLHARQRIVSKGNTGLVSAHQDSLYAQGGAEHAQLGHVEDGLGRGRERGEAVADLETDVLDRRRFGDGGEAEVDVELRVLAGDVVVGQARGLVERHVGRRRRGRVVAAHDATDRLVEHAQVQVETDGLHEAGLLRTEQVPRPAELHVLQGDAVAGAEFGVMLED